MIRRPPGSTLTETLFPSRRSSELLARAPRLEVVSSISVGVDKYQIDAFQRRAITLCHTPGVLTETVADLLFAMTLATSRRILDLGRYVQQGRWKRRVGEDMYAWDVNGKTLDILVYGSNSQALAQRAALGLTRSLPSHTPRPASN